MKYLKTIFFVVLLVSIMFIGTSYALWRHDSEIKFTLTISFPENEFNCGTYDTIQEGLELLKGCKYNFIVRRLDEFAGMLEARIEELNGLPVGGLSWDELREELKQYRKVDMEKYKSYIHKYKGCIDKLADFYRKSTPEEKEKVPDFWDQHKHLYDLHNELWTKWIALYPLINEVERLGQSKIDW